MLLIVLVGLLLTGAGVWIALSGPYLLIRDATRRQEWRQVDGTIVAVEPAGSAGMSDPECIVAYRYEVDGQAYAGTFRQRHRPSGTQAGQPFIVLVDPRNPNRWCRMQGMTAGRCLLRLIIGSVVAAGSFLGMILLGFAYAARGPS